MKDRAFDRRTHPPGATFSAWAAGDGWAIRRMDWPQSADGKARGSLIFAGGRGDFIEKYLEPLGHWHDAGWNVTSFDWRGQGESRGHIIGGHLDSFDPLAADFDALVKDWRAASAGPHVLIGHSMGGHLLLRLLTEYEPQVDAAVLVAPMIGINAAPVPPWLGRTVARALTALGLRKRRAWKSNERPAPAGRLRQTYLTNCADRYDDEIWWKERSPGFDLGPPSWGWLKAAFRSMARATPDRLRAMRTPLLILATPDDRLVSPKAIRAAVAYLPAAELHMYDGSGHEILRERDQVRLDALARIDAFLARHAPA